MTRRFFTALILFLTTFSALSSAYAQNTSAGYTPPPFLNQGQHWVDSVFNSLSPDERIAQLLAIAAYSNKDKAFEDTIQSLITRYKVGGVTFFQGSPARQAHLTNRYQAASKVPLMVSIDGEWGLAMRLDSVPAFPYQMSLGAIQDNSLIYEMGMAIGRQCKRMGIHVNFAPVADVNNNPKNPVINYRSFGEDKYNVTQKSYAYMKGMQDVGVLANAKHFPGHGDTDADSHHTLPIIKHNRQRLDSLELFPFQQLSRAGLGSAMIAHLSIPALDPTPKQASSLSKPIVTGIFRNELGYQGLLFTDGMGMKGVAEHYPSGVAEAKALIAGNDIVLLPRYVPATLREIKKAVQDGHITQQEIDDKCRRVLMAKYWAGLHKPQPVEVANVTTDLNHPETIALIRKLSAASLTLLRHQPGILPLQEQAGKRIAIVSVGSAKPTLFQQQIQQNSKADFFNLAPAANQEAANKILQAVQGYDVIIVGIHLGGRLTNMRPTSNFGISAPMASLANGLASTGKAIITVFGNAYALERLDKADQAAVLITTYQESAYTQEAAVNFILGRTPASGRLPVTVSGKFKVGDGIRTEK